MIAKKPDQPESIEPTYDEEDDEDLFDYFYDEPGAIPGQLIIDPEAPASNLILIDYNEAAAVRKKFNRPQNCAPYLDTSSVSWLDVQGLGSEDILKELGSVFNIHPLALEDVVNVPQRPKVEEYPNQLVIITQMVLLKEKVNGFWIEQVSFILGNNYIITVQEEPEDDCFDPVRDRIHYNKGLIRQKGTDYLAYCLLDAIIDGYFPVLEDYGERIEELEDEVVINPSRKTLEQIYKVKRELLALRRAIWPLRDAINALIRDTSTFITPDVRIYLRDCYDHTIQVLDIVETYRDLASGLMEVYLSSVGNKMNEIMKFLTVVSSIFIPLTFIAGVYGMNFNTEKSPWNMPELNWEYGYVACIVLMILIAGGLVYLFWRRGWFENSLDIKPKDP